jgi:hypothetical protein
MGRPRQAHPQRPLPPPLPPETRTVGQLVAETLRLYGRRFWLALPLGISLAATFQVIYGRSIWAQVVALWLASPFLTASYVGASALALGVRPTLRSSLVAFATGILVFLPAPALMTVFVLPAVAWLALFGLTVPVALKEETGVRASLGRARRLAAADYVHALGSLATLTILFFLTALMLGFLLQGQGEQTARVAAFLATLTLSPILFLGAALLYFDQAARVVGSGSRPRPRRKPDADLHHADHAHRAGRPDPEVQP